MLARGLAPASRFQFKRHIPSLEGLLNLRVLILGVEPRKLVLWIALIAHPFHGYKLQKEEPPISSETESSGVQKTWPQGGRAFEPAVIAGCFLTSRTTFFGGNLGTAGFSILRTRFCFQGSLSSKNENPAGSEVLGVAEIPCPGLAGSFAARAVGLLHLVGRGHRRAAGAGVALQGVGDPPLLRPVGGPEDPLQEADVHWVMVTRQDLTFREKSYSWPLVFEKGILRQTITCRNIRGLEASGSEGRLCAPLDVQIPRPPIQTKSERQRRFENGSQFQFSSHTSAIYPLLGP